VPADPHDAGYCHGVIARIVEQPWRSPVDGCAGLGLDVNRLRGVVGQITKVRHNPVRARLPITFRTLAATGCELEFFADYAPEFTSRRRDGIDQDERVASFAAALRDWLDANDHGGPIGDVLDHELTLLSVAAEPPVAAPQRGTRVRLDSVPRCRPGVRIRQLGVFPPEVVAALHTGTGLDSLDRTIHWYAYVPTVLGPRIKQLAPACAPVVALADGTATVDDIAGRLGVGDRAADIAALFEVLVDNGLMDIEQPCD
jgi:hypothetical protein